MTLSTDIDFRGSTREVEFEHEGDGVIVWWFTYDGGETGQADATDAEQQVICEALWAYLIDRWASDDDIR